eukprot:jgi/Tetstr1/440364/TSEL_028699.t1
MEGLEDRIKAWNRSFVEANKRKPGKRDLSPGIERMLAEYKRRKRYEAAGQAEGRPAPVQRSYPAAAHAAGQLTSADVSHHSLDRSPSPRARHSAFSDDSEDERSHVSATPEPTCKGQPGAQGAESHPATRCERGGARGALPVGCTASSTTGTSHPQCAAASASGAPAAPRSNTQTASEKGQVSLGKGGAASSTPARPPAEPAGCCLPMVASEPSSAVPEVRGFPPVRVGVLRAGASMQAIATRRQLEPRVAPPGTCAAAPPAPTSPGTRSTGGKSEGGGHAPRESVREAHPVLVPVGSASRGSFAGGMAAAAAAGGVASTVAKAPPAKMTKKPPARLLNLSRQAGSAAPAGGSPDPQLLDHSTAQKGKGTNFVRTHMKGKRGVFSYKMSGGKSRSRRGPVPHRGAKTPPRAGDGADIEDEWSAPVAVAEAAPEAGSPRRPGAGERGGTSSPPVQTEVKGGAGIPRKGAGGHAAGPSSAPPALHAAGTVPAASLQRPTGVAGDHSEENLLAVLSAEFGHNCFRGRQLQAVQSVLRGQSALAILPTGAGKSLCYQLPAMLLPGLCLVISPLIALMKDQLARLPACLPGAMISSAENTRETLQAVAAGRVKVLYVSPERLLNRAFQQALAHLPELSMVCVDEAHCVAEWGHNFRPAFYRLGHLLRQRDGPLRLRSILALTATATRQTEATVCDVLGIPPSQVIRDCPMRDNLRLGVMRASGGAGSSSTTHAVGRLLSGPLKGARAIVYCGFQAHAEQMAKFLFVNGAKAEAYHAGMRAEARSDVQAMFCAGKLRIICATVAFGMGIDAQVDAVIHTCMPRSLEEYVQQVGRAGRDGSEAKCVLMMDDQAFLRFRSLAYGDCVDAPALELLLSEVFSPLTKRASKRKAADASRPVYGILPRKPVSTSTDIKEEVIETVLAYLQSAEEAYLKVLPNTVSRVDLMFYKTAPAELSKCHPIIAAFLSATRGRAKKSGAHSAAMADFCTHRCAPPAQVVHELQELASLGEIGFSLSKVPAFAYQIHAAAGDIPGLAQEIASRLESVEAQQVRRIDACYRTFACALQQKGAGQAVFDTSTEAAVRRALDQYFKQPSLEELQEAPGGAALPFEPMPTQIRGDIQLLNRMGVSTLGHQDLSVRAMGRVLHGLASPGCNVDRFKSSGLWGRYQACDFAAVMDAIEAELGSANQQCTFEEERDERVARNREMLARMLNAD